MWITLPKLGILLNLYCCLSLIATNMPVSNSVPASAVLLNASPVNVKRMLFHPYGMLRGKSIPKHRESAPTEEYYYDQVPSFSESDAFLMEPDDALSETRYSLPIDTVDLQRKRQYRGELTINGGITMPTTYEDDFMPSLHPRYPLVNPNIRYENPTENPPTSEDEYYYMPEKHNTVTEATVTSDYKVQNTLSPPLGNRPIVSNNRDNHFQPHLVKNNFTHINSSQISVPSKTVLSYEPHPKSIVLDENVRLRGSVNSTVVDQTLSSKDETVDASDSLQNDMPDFPVHTEPTQEVMNSYTTTIENTVYYIANKTTTASPPNQFDVGDNISNVKPSVQSTKHEKLTSGAVTGIVIAVLTSVTFITSSVIYLLYKKYNGKCTSVVESKFNSDNCGYLDDSIRSSVYLNNHIELPKENSEEMTSLDNDSFLNSLETMTIQNYWADSTKNTKV